MEGLNQMKDAEKWFGSTMETEQQPILDPGTGKPVILRRFDFMYPPGGKKPTKKQLLTPEYLKHLDNTLWLDELERIMLPRVTFKKKGFSIFVPCHPKKGSAIPRYAQDQLSKPLHERLQEKDNG